MFCSTPSKKAKQREAVAKEQAVASQQGKKNELVHEMYRTIRLHFPELFDWMREVDDCCKKASDYEKAIGSLCFSYPV